MGRRIYVGNLPWRASDEDLKAFFSQVGRVRECEIVRKPDGASKGFGFIEFETEEEAEAALQFNRREMLGRPLTVDRAKDKPHSRDRDRNRERAGHARPGMRRFETPEGAR